MSELAILLDVRNLSSYLDKISSPAQNYVGDDEAAVELQRVPFLKLDSFKVDFPL